MNDLTDAQTKTLLSVLEITASLTRMKLKIATQVVTIATRDQRIEVLEQHLDEAHTALRALSGLPTPVLQ